MLIHSAAGGFGQAVDQLGQSCTGRKWGGAEALTLDGFDRQGVQIAGRTQGAY